MILESAITCPNCATVKTESMPTDACRFFYQCTGCGTMLKPKHGDCCVFCSYGSVPCPPIQAARSANDLPSPTERCPVELSHPQVHARAAILLVQAVVLALLE